MVSISIPTAIAIGASAIGGVASAYIGGQAAKSAAKTQSNAALQAAGLIKPYNTAGTAALGDLETGLGIGTGHPGELNKPFNPTMADLEGTPGYKFALQQGLIATQSGFASQGLGQSGAGMKGAGLYAQGLASQTYQQQFENYLAQNQQRFGMLNSLVQTGANAAVGQGTQITNAAAARAAGTVGQANALAGGISSVTSPLATIGYLGMMKDMGMYSSSGAASGSAADSFGKMIG